MFEGGSGGGALSAAPAEATAGAGATGNGPPRHLRLALELLDPPQLPEKLAGVGRPAIRLLGEQAGHDLACRHRQVGADLARVPRLRVEDLVDERRDRLARKRPRAGQKLVEHDAQREEIGPAVDLLAPDLLGRHVGRASDHLARPRHVGARRGGELSDAEVGHLHAAVFGDQDVAGLDVAVDDVPLVGVRQGLGGLADDRDLGRERELLSAAEVPRERPALDVLHGDEVEVAVAAHVEDGDDVGMLQAAGELRLLEEAGLDLGRRLSARGLGVDRLDRDRPVDLGVMRQVDDAHRPLAEHRGDLETPELRARGKDAHSSGESGSESDLREVASASRLCSAIRARASSARSGGTSTRVAPSAPRSSGNGEGRTLDLTRGCLPTRAGRR